VSTLQLSIFSVQLSIFSKINTIDTSTPQKARAEAAEGPHPSEAQRKTQELEDRLKEMCPQDLSCRNLKHGTDKPPAMSEIQGVC
jgi:hypothetical protein